ncbi:CAP domain-containing protein [Tsuneonella sp. HG249]
MRRLIAPVAGALAIVLAAMPAHADPRGDFARRLLEAHNAERDRAGLPALAWSSKLAHDAQGWAGELSRQGTLQHADDYQRRGMGENLWMGTAGHYSAEDMVGGFIAERAKFRPGTFPQVSRTGNWADVGHYTQIIWPATTEVGCAVAKGGAHDFLVCRYNPAGNVVGDDVGYPNWSATNLAKASAR